MAFVILELTYVLVAAGEGVRPLPVVLAIPELTDVLIAVEDGECSKAVVLQTTFRTRRQGRLRPSHQGQEKAEDEKFAHGQMLVEKSMFGIHHAGGFGLIYSALHPPTVPLPT